MRDDALAYLNHQRLDVILGTVLTLGSTAMLTVVAGLDLSGAGCVFSDQIVQQGAHSLAKLFSIHPSVTITGKS